MIILKIASEFVLYWFVVAALVCLSITYAIGVFALYAGLWP